MNSHDSRQASQAIIDNDAWITAQKAEVISNELDIAVERNELNKIAMLGLNPKKDGNQWCFLFGDNLQEGVCGFGDTVYKAALDFNKNFMNEKAS